MDQSIESADKATTQIIQVANKGKSQRMARLYTIAFRDSLGSAGCVWESVSRSLDYRPLNVNVKYNVAPPLVGTLFDRQRFNTKDSYDNEEIDMFYDINSYYNITEDILNDVLTNITLSAISLGTWWDRVPVTTTRYQATHSFANPLNLILPYSICLAAATVFATIAIWSLWQNDTPAVDGGFLQIMMATRGSTEMEKLVVREGSTTIDNISDELKNLKVRYGELIGDDVLGVEERILGFGKVEETVSLRKRS
jgi:hypothetical protein